MAIQKGNQIGITILKTNAREGSDKLKVWHYKVNDLMYKYQQRYIAPKTARMIYDKLVEYGKELNKMEVPQSANTKKQELLAGLRDTCKCLKKYKEEVYLGEEDKEAVEQAMRYQVANFLKLKNSDSITTKAVIELLEDGCEVWNDMVQEYPSIEELKTASFMKTHREMIGYLENKYGIG